jgi:type VI secretion system secreted protein VgrG
MPATQDHRFAKITSSLGTDTLLFYRMTGAESLSEPFEFQLEMLSEKPDIDPNSILGKALSVNLVLPSGAPRYFHGHVCRFGRTGIKGRFYRYGATLRPWLWFLSRAHNCRIFQQETVPDIIKKVLSAHGFSDFKLSLSGTHASREYCVQYRETDLNFVSRLMEEEGIYYFFQHEKNKHTLVLADSIDAHKPVADYATLSYTTSPGVLRGRKEYIFDWAAMQGIQTGAVTLRDFNFETPTQDLTVASAASYSHEHGAYEWYDYPGKYAAAGDGRTLASCRLDEFGAQHDQFTGASNAMGLTTGALFTLADHPCSNQNAQYLLLETRFAIESDEYESGGGGADFQCSFTALHRDTPFRPPQRAVKPAMRGPQTAIVVGKSGEEIWTDRYGRIKVQFHWDREGKKDENSSCWVRVSQPWAGKGWGAIAIPRIGQEVIVDFLEGDPDRPIVTGRVYNADQTVPYTLPDNATQTGIKSRSSKGGTGDNFNEIRLEDKKGSEEIFVQAEKDMNVVIENNETRKIGFDKKDKGNQTIDIYNDRTVTLDQGNDTLTVKTGNRVVTVEKGDDTHTVKQGNRVVSVDTGNDTHTVKTGNRVVSVDTGNDTHTVKTGNREVNVNTGNDTHNVKMGNREVTVSMGNDTLTIKMGNQTTKLNLGSSTTEAMMGIELKVGANSIKIDQSGITIKGMMVKIEGTMMAEVKSGLMTKVEGSAMLMAKGGITMIN